MARPTVNDDLTPDMVVDMPARTFAAKELGLTGEPIPLTHEPLKSTSTERQLRLRSVSDLGNKVVGSNVRVIIDISPGVSALIPYRKVAWKTGPQPSIELTLTEDPVAVYYVGKGYSYGRFITFRGAEARMFLPGFTGDDLPGDSVSTMISDNVETVTITTPNDPAWQQVKTITHP